MRWLERRRRRRKWRAFYRADRYGVQLTDELTGDYRAAVARVDRNGDVLVTPVGPKRLRVSTGVIFVPVTIGRHELMSEAEFTLDAGPATLDAGDALLLTELTQ